MRIKIVLIIIFLFVFGVDRVSAVLATCGGVNAGTTTSATVSQAQIDAENAKQKALVAQQEKDKAAADLAALQTQTVNSVTIDPLVSVALERAVLRLQEKEKEVDTLFTIVADKNNTATTLEVNWNIELARQAEQEQNALAAAAAQVGARAAEAPVQYYSDSSDPGPSASSCSGCGCGGCRSDEAPAQSSGNESVPAPADNTPQQSYESFFDWGSPPSNDCWYCYNNDDSYI
ncbi:hypothetical protein HZB69_03205 [Candidatus Amesbacteria bacterium]|nr:hypothetical protein [Candidatus Amesbacteria bacterium]